MKFETPATTNPIDALNIVGKPFSRIDGPLKTTGKAPYAYERHDVVSNPAYGYVVGSAIAKGRIARIDLAAVKGTGQPRPLFGGPADTALGDFSGAFAAAPVQLDATYTTPDQAHAMMEPHASIAAWDGDKLTLWTSNQMIAWGVADVAKTLGIAKENVRLVSPFVGGGFGG